MASEEEQVSPTASAGTSLVPTDSEAEPEDEGFIIVNPVDIPHCEEQLQQNSGWRSAAWLYPVVIQSGLWFCKGLSVWQNPANITFDDWLKEVETGRNNSADEETFKHICLQQAARQHFQKITETENVFEPEILETAVLFTREEIQYANQVSSQRNRRFLCMILNRDYTTILKFLWKLISKNKEVVDKVIDCYKTELDKSNTLPANQCTKCLLQDRVNICLIVDCLAVILKDFHKKVSEEVEPAMPSVSERLWKELFEQTGDSDSYQSVITLITGCIEVCGYHADIVRRLKQDKVLNRNSFHCFCQIEHTDAEQENNVSNTLSVKRNTRRKSECQEEQTRLEQAREHVSTKEKKKCDVSSSEACFKQHQSKTSKVSKRKMAQGSGRVKKTSKPFNKAKKSKNSLEGQKSKPDDGYALDQLLPSGTQNSSGNEGGASCDLQMELLKHGKREYDEFEDSKVSTSSSENTDSGVGSSFKKRQRDEETERKQYCCEVDFPRFYNCDADNIRTSASYSQANGQVKEDSEKEYSKMDLEVANETLTKFDLDDDESGGSLEGEPMSEDEDSSGV